MIDLRSDTVTLPTPAMREAMAQAEVGDDVFGEDPTVLALERRVADMLGKEAALYVPSGTMSNQLGVRVHCQGGDEFLCDDQCHIYHYEQGAYAQLFGVAAQPVATRWGLPTIDQLAPRVRGTDFHHPRTRLLALENTHNRHGGTVLDPAQTAELCTWAASVGLARHLDGARIWNAAIAAGKSVEDLATPFDTVSVCFSKGLGAPVGSALAGPADLIAQARRTRKALGGGVRQMGILAAGALHALEHHFPKLGDDHHKADHLRQVIRDTPQLKPFIPGSAFPYPSDEPLPQLTNLVYFDIDTTRGTNREFCDQLADRGVRMLPVGTFRVRAVTHIGVTMEEIERAGEILMDTAEGFGR